MRRVTRREAMVAVATAVTAISGCSRGARVGAPSGSVGAGLAGQDPVLTSLSAAHKAEQSLLQLFDACAAATQQDDPELSVLYRALGRSCEIRLEALTKLIVSRDGAVPDTPSARAAGSLIEGLQVAIEDVNDLAGDLYPQLRATAARAKDTKALEVLSYGVQVLPELGALLQSAANGIAAGAVPTVRAYYVCPTCGHVAESLDFDECPYCYTVAKDFERIALSS